MAATNSEVWQRGSVVAATTVADGIRRIEIETSLPARADAGSHIDVVRMSYAEFERLAQPELLWLAHVM